MTETLPGGLTPLNMKHADWCPLSNSLPDHPMKGAQQCRCGDQRCQRAYDLGLADGQYYELHANFTSDDDEARFDTTQPTTAQRLAKALIEFGVHGRACSLRYQDHLDRPLEAQCDCGFAEALKILDVNPSLWLITPRGTSARING